MARVAARRRTSSELDRQPVCSPAWHFSPCTIRGRLSLYILFFLRSSALLLVSFCTGNPSASAEAGCYPASGRPMALQNRDLIMSDIPSLVALSTTPPPPHPDPLLFLRTPQVILPRSHPDHEVDLVPLLAGYGAHLCSRMPTGPCRSGNDARGRPTFHRQPSLSTSVPTVQSSTVRGVPGWTVAELPKSHCRQAVLSKPEQHITCHRLLLLLLLRLLHADGGVACSATWILVWAAACGLSVRIFGCRPSHPNCMAGSFQLFILHSAARASCPSMRFPDVRLCGPASLPLKTVPAVSGDR